MNFELFKTESDKDWKYKGIRIRNKRQTVRRKQGSCYDAKLYRLFFTKYNEKLLKHVLLLVELRSDLYCPISWQNKKRLGVKLLQQNKAFLSLMNTFLRGNDLCSSKKIILEQRSMKDNGQVKESTRPVQNCHRFMFYTFYREVPSLPVTSWPWLSLQSTIITTPLTTLISFLECK